MNLNFVDRLLELYAAYIIVVVIYIAIIAWVSQELNDPDDLNQFNIGVFMSKPLWQTIQTLPLRYKPVNLDVLPLYILLLGTFAPALWLMVRKPTLTLISSMAVYFAARHFGWNLAASPSGSWYFNPFAWQLLFFLGAWTAPGGARALQPIIETKTVFWLAIGYLAFAFIVTTAIRVADIGGLVPHWILQPFDPNDKTNLAPYRIIHLIALAVMPLDSPILQWRSLVPLIKCGKNSLQVLRRHCAIVLCPRCDRTKLELAVGSNSWGYDGNSAHDGGRILLDVVQTE